MCRAFAVEHTRAVVGRDGVWAVAARTLSEKKEHTLQKVTMHAVGVSSTHTFIWTGVASAYTTSATNTHCA